MPRQKGYAIYTEQFSFRLDLETAEALKRLAKEHDLNVQEYLRFILSRWLVKEEIEKREQETRNNVYSEFANQIKKLSLTSIELIDEIDKLKIRVADLENTKLIGNINT